MEHETWNIVENLALMRELLSCGTQIDLWHYSAGGDLISTTSEHLVLDKIFEGTGNKSFLISYAQKNQLPIILGADLGMMWCAVFHRMEGKPHSIFVLGPVFHTEISSKTIEESVRHHNIDLGWRQSYMHLMRELPVVSSILFFQYALMVHYCITGEKLRRSDIQHRAWSSTEGTKDSAADTAPRRDRIQTWLAERTLLNMVREGDLNFQKAIDQAGNVSNGVRSGGKNPLLHALVSCTSFTSLCVREAIEAGISPEMAYSVGDSYIQSMVAAKDISELNAISHTMYEDFIMRVHKHRTNPHVSHYIQACRDYIELHTDEALSLSVLARRVGYSESHLSRKFKQEMGVSVSTYIKYARVERAKFMLTATQNSVSKIAESLQFCSSSHFSDAFQEVTGMKPQQYRKEHQKI